ncbi:MAG: hypothetical protein HYX76_15135 [Acidobacteria bacterium]|nr:hypothetical protein [Acidobacteriota bacterium]
MASVASAQIAMPDAREMSGVPRPVSDLPDGAISVRLIRGSLGNNLTNHQVELRAGDKVLKEKTDEAGRAEFSGVAAGTVVRAVAVVDGERLESQDFEVPAQGGIRVMLVASAKPAGGGAGATEVPRPPQPGVVVLGSQSRFATEIGDDALQVYYLFQILNNARAPVTTPGPLIFDMPTGAQGTSLLQGTTPRAVAKGPRVTVMGPFEPGATSVQIAYQLPMGSARIAITQKLPVAMEQVSVVAQKIGNMSIESTQISNRREETADGRQFIVAGGPGIRAGGTFSMELTGLPHHGTTARYLVLALALAILGAGAWGAASVRRPELSPHGKRLVARRDTLLDELAQMEARLQSGALDPLAYRQRRRELVAKLEPIYAELDEIAPRFSVAVPPLPAVPRVVGRTKTPA